MQHFRAAVYRCSCRWAGPGRVSLRACVSAWMVWNLNIGAAFFTTHGNFVKFICRATAASLILVQVFLSHIPRAIWACGVETIGVVWPVPACMLCCHVSACFYIGLFAVMFVSGTGFCKPRLCGVECLCHGRYWKLGLRASVVLSIEVVFSSLTHQDGTRSTELVFCTKYRLPWVISAESPTSCTPTSTPSAAIPCCVCERNIRISPHYMVWRCVYVQIRCYLFMGGWMSTWTRFERHN